MSYFNEPTRLAVLNLMPEVEKAFNSSIKQPTEDKKGLLSRTVKEKIENRSVGMTEIEKIRNYMVNIRREMNKYNTDHVLTTDKEE